MKKIMLGVLLFMLTLAACNVPTTAPTLAPTQPPTPTVEQPSFTAPVKPTSTITIAPSATTEITKTPTLTPTQASTPTPNFLGLKLMFADIKSWGYLVSLYVPGINSDYQITVNGATYTCSPEASKPDTINCFGQPFPGSSLVKVSFFLPPNQTPVYTGSVLLPPDPTPIYTPDPCVARGTVGLYCEREPRHVPFECVVMSCSDVCGWWYSVDTCTPQELTATAGAH